MKKTIVALYDDFGDANRAIRDLIDEGFNRESISIVANDARGHYRDYLDEPEDRAVVEEDSTAEGAGIGAGIGAAIGGIAGLLIGLGALTIPGIGPVIAAGPLAAALAGLAGAGAGAVAGGVTGGLLGALVDLGVPSETAHYYAEGIRRGGTMVIVSADEASAPEIVDILNDHGPVDINDRVETWEESGWSGFNPDADPYFNEEREWPEPAYRTEDMAMYEDFAPSFRNHFQTVTTGVNYDYADYEPAYRFGYDLAMDENYRDYDDWSQVERPAQMRWERDHLDPWDQVKDSIRHAWREVKDAVS